MAIAPPMDWLLVKGLARGQVHWGRFPEALEERLPGHRALRLDLPGVGTAVRLRAPWTVGGIVEDLRARWQTLRAAAPAVPREERPAAVLGISLGGMVVLEWLARYPDDFERSVVVVASSADTAPPWRRLLPSALPGYLHALFERDFGERERRVLSIITNDAAALEERIAENVRHAPLCPLPPAACARQLTAASIWRAPGAAELERLPHPPLFLGTRGDRMVHPACTVRLAARYGCTPELHDRGGHELPYDDPDWVADRVAASLEG